MPFVTAAKLGDVILIGDMLQSRNSAFAVRRVWHPFFFDHVRSLLCDHDRGCVSVTRNNVRHYGCVYDSESKNTVHTQSGVHDGVWVCRRSHLARPHWMVDCHAVVSCCACPVVVGQELEVLATWDLILVNPRRQAPHSSGLAHGVPELCSFNLQEKKCFKECANLWILVQGDRMDPVETLHEP